ncbi:MAG: glycine dehydrogenase (aminomethyl-transferring), partial [Proteobacteria bacterium]
MDAAPFLSRHIGPSDSDAAKMLGELGCSDLEQFIARVVPGPIRLKESIGSFNFSAPLTESLALSALEAIASKNKVFRSFIGLGYFGNITPPVIQRNILENPGWYTQYTPYQAEIAQGRLEALLNFQTMVCDLTGLPVANASLLDEATAAAEAMYMCFARAQGGAKTFIVSETCHPQTIAVVQTRAQALGVKVVVAAGREPELNKDIFGVLLQCPATDGVIFDYKKIIEKAHACGALVCVASDLLYLTLFTPPGELGADIAIGSAQRFGVPLGFGGPHAAFMACKDELKRIMPGRLIGVSKDSAGKAALRLSLQTREQHIRREKATSNICTAQVLLAVMASMYAVYHGPQGLRRIAKRVHFLTKALLKALASHGLKVTGENVFDTIKVELSAEQKLEAA